MFHGLTGKYQKELPSHNQYSDVIFVTYYPLQPDFSVQNPSVVFTDMNKLAPI